MTCMLCYRSEVKRIYTEFQYKADSWDKERRVVAKIEWPPGELLPKIGFIVTNMKKKPEEVVEFYNKRGTAELCIKEGKRTFNWTRLSCKRFRKDFGVAGFFPEGIRRCRIFPKEIRQRSACAHANR